MPRLKMNCGLCNIEFIYKLKYDRTRKYCTNKCVGLAAKIEIKCICINCKKEFIKQRDALGKFCSPKCKQIGSRHTKESRLSKLKECIEKNVIIQSGCWGWNGPISTNGYGLVWAGRNSSMNAHRASWLVYKGEIPKGKHVLHSCDNRLCNNYLEHLSLGTPKDNMQDALKKGRMRGHFIKGIKPHNRSLSDDVVKKIKKMRLQNIPCKEIAIKFNINKDVVKDISRNRSYKDITI